MSPDPTHEEIEELRQILGALNARRSEALLWSAGDLCSCPVLSRQISGICPRCHQPISPADLEDAAR